MWPKVLMQLFELLPHVSRLIPLADRYLASRSTSDATSQAALAALAENVQGDLGQVAKAHDSLFRRMQEQDNLIADLREEVRQMRSTAETGVRRVQMLDDEVASVALWLKITAGMVAILMVLVVILLLHSH
jgi:methyl-accepting chemotaxis protein